MMAFIISMGVMLRSYRLALAKSFFSPIAYARARAGGEQKKGIKPSVIHGDVSDMRTNSCVNCGKCSAVPCKRVFA